ncbi:MAG: hypothetical protein V1663_02915 [archaeon]
MSLRSEIGAHGTFLLNRLKRSRPDLRLIVNLSCSESKGLGLCTASYSLDSVSNEESGEKKQRILNVRHIQYRTKTQLIDVFDESLADTVKLAVLALNEGYGTNYSLTLYVPGKGYKAKSIPLI